MCKQYQGYTLIELLIALAISIVVLAGVTTVFIGSIKTSASAIRTSEFNQEMRSIMSVITRDVKRAGYYKNAVNDLGTGKNNNTFITDVSATSGEPMKLWSNIASTTAAIPLTDTNTNGVCITYAYDQAGTIGDGVLTLNSDDLRGFRLSSNHTVQTRIAGGAKAPSPNCNTGMWQDITSPDINVTKLTFQWLDYTNINDPPSTTNPADFVRDHAVISQRVIHVVLSANSKSDVTLARTFQAYIHVRNNLYNPYGTYE